MNYVKKIQFDESFKVKDESYKQTADDMTQDIDNYFDLASKGQTDKILFSMTGENGTGKTTFLKHFLIPDLKKKYDVQYFSILNVLDTFEPNQPDLKERLYEKTVQFDKWKGIKLISTKIDVMSVIFTFLLTLLWTGYFTALSQYHFYPFHNAGYIVYLIVNIIFSVLFFALLAYNFVLTKNQLNTKIGHNLKHKSHAKRKVVFIDDLSRIPMDLEKEIMIKLASMRDYSKEDVGTLFFLVNSNGLVINDTDEDDFINKFVYSIYDMVFDKNLIISVFTNAVHKPTNEDMNYLNSINNLRDLNAYIRRLNDKINTDNKSISKTTDKDIKEHIIKRMKASEKANKNKD